MPWEKRRWSFYRLFAAGEGDESYQSVDSDLEQNFEKLIAGVNETFRKRSISLLEFIDYYESYKETCIQLYDTRKDLLLAMENLNRVIGQNVFNY